MPNANCLMNNSMKDKIKEKSVLFQKLLKKNEEAKA